MALTPTPQEVNDAYGGAIPATALSVAERLALSRAEIERGGFRKDVEQAKIAAIEREATQEWDARWDMHVSAAATEEDQDLGALKESIRRPVHIDASETTQDREFRHAVTARNAEQLARTQLRVNRIAVSESAAEIMGYVNAALLSEHADMIEFTLKAAADRCAMQERRELRGHTGQARFRSDWAGPRGRCADLLEAWERDHPPVDVQIARLEQRKIARLATLAHIRAEATRRLMNPPPGHGKPERTGPTPEPAGTGDGIVLGRAFVSR